MTSALAQPRLRIMLADADHDFFTKITLLLDEMAPRRFVLEWASTYGFAVTVMRRQRFDLCLVSSHIGHRSGNDLVRHLQSNHPGSPVILLAHSEEMLEAAEGHPLECLDRHRLSVEMLRQAIRDSLFRSAAGTPKPAGLAQSAASEFVRAAA